MAETRISPPEMAYLQNPAEQLAGKYTTTDAEGLRDFADYANAQAKRLDPCPPSETGLRGQALQAALSMHMLSRPDDQVAVDDIVTEAEKLLAFLKGEEQPNG